MTDREYPRVLILNQPFNYYSGGGITISNLFKGWPKEKIAVAATGHSLYNAVSDSCDTYYQLGTEEHKWIFPLNLIQKSFPSGLKTFENISGVSKYSSKSKLRHAFINSYINPILEWLGLIHGVTKISLSEKFKKWLSEYQPEILYIQASRRDTILFAIRIIKFLKIPAFYHFMDDWPSTICVKSVFQSYWKSKIDAELRELLDMVDVNLSISDAMAIEYSKRYNKKFITFHNPIETESWLKHTKNIFYLRKDNVKILYSGRIGIGITDSLENIASAIEKTNSEAINIKLHIQTRTQDHEIINRLVKYSCVIINPFVEYEELPKIFAEADILVLPNDFDALGSAYLKYSMPTKASEYMISGTPVLVYAPKDNAVLEFFKDQDCGLCVSEQSIEALQGAIQFIIDNEEFRRKISQNSVTLAKIKFDAKIIQEEFQNLLINSRKGLNDYIQD
ncbi:glycosyltransferase [Bacteroidota bacterium]